MRIGWSLPLDGEVERGGGPDRDRSWERVEIVKKSIRSPVQAGREVGSRSVPAPPTTEESSGLGRRVGGRRGYRGTFTLRSDLLGTSLPLEPVLRTYDRPRFPRSEQGCRGLSRRTLSPQVDGRGCTDLVSLSVVSFDFRSPVHWTRPGLVFRKIFQSSFPRVWTRWSFGRIPFPLLPSPLLFLSPLPFPLTPFRSSFPVPSTSLSGQTGLTIETDETPSTKCIYCSD